MKAVVMAGGEGTRLRPLTSNQPKPMVPIVGKPCMEHILELLREHGFEDVIVTVAFLPQAIRSYFGDGEALGPRTSSTRSRSRRSARPARCGSPRDQLDETVPRHLRRRALRHRPRRRSSQFHQRARGAAVTIGLKSVENPLEFGIVVTDEDGRIERFLEKPSWGQVFSDTINTGIYVLEPEVLRHVPDRPAVRLLEGALPAAARDGPAALRLRAATATGRTSGTSTSTGRRTSTRSTSSVALEHPRHPAARQRLDRRGRRDRRPRRGRGAGVHRQLLPRSRREASVGAVLGARRERDAARARPRSTRSVIDAGDAHRPQRAASRARSSAAPATSARTSRIHEGAAIGDEVDARRAERASCPASGSTRTRRSSPARRSTRA